jgi:hypothetical protein
MRFVIAVILVLLDITSSLTIAKPASFGWRAVRSSPDVGTVPLRSELLKTAALSFMPWLEIHHVVLLETPHSDKIFAIDYTPINQTAPGTVKKLIMGQSVPAEVRCRIVDACKFTSFFTLCTAFY